MIPEMLVHKFFYNSGHFEYSVTLERGMRIDERGVAHQHCVGTNMGINYLSFSYPDAYRVLNSFWIGKSKLLDEEEFSMFLERVSKFRERVQKAVHDFPDGELLRDSEHLQRLLKYRAKLERVLGQYDWGVK